MSYRLVGIKVERSWPGWSARPLLSDLPDSDDPKPFRGFDVEADPKWGLTHRWAFRRALRANGGRIW